jgi:serine/threonine protein kinase
MGAMSAMGAASPRRGRGPEVLMMSRQPPVGHKLSMSIEALHVGSVIDGRYEIMDILGEGGFGVVYKARQLATDQLVAVKVLVPTKITNVQRTTIEMRRFEREIRLVAQLQHPNIVRLLDAGRLRDGRLYMALEFIHGEELSDVLDREGRLEPFEAKFLMLQVLDALTAAHGKGIIHRDLKPQNIMITRQGARRNAMVVDFGIGTLIEHARGEDMAVLTATGQILGTPSYMAPEQLRGVLTAQSDIYAWGLVFYECLTGRRAVYAPSVYEVIHEQMSDRPVPIHPALLDTDVGRLIYYATIKDLPSRYPSVEVLHQVLERCNTETEDLKLALAQVPLPTDQPPRNEGQPPRQAADGGGDFHDQATRAFDGPGAPSPPKHDQATRLIDPDAPSAHRPAPAPRDVPTQAIDISPDGAPSPAPPQRRPGSAKGERGVQTQAVAPRRAPKASGATSGVRLQPPKRRRPGDETINEPLPKRRAWAPIIWVLLSGLVAFGVVWSTGIGLPGQKAPAKPAPPITSRTSDQPGLTSPDLATSPVITPHPTRQVTSDPPDVSSPLDPQDVTDTPLTALSPTNTSPDDALSATAAPTGDPPIDALPNDKALIIDASPADPALTHEPPIDATPDVIDPPPRPTTPEIRLVTLPTLDATLGLNQEQLQEAVRRHGDPFAFDLQYGEGLLSAQTWPRPPLEVMTTELTWAQLAHSRHLMPDLDSICPSAEPLREGPALEAVIGVGASEATYICASLGMRLPTAREWEAIARGDEQRLYAFDGLLDPTKQAALARHRTPGALPWNQTPDGIYDLSGSTWEWVTCEDSPPELSYCTLSAPAPAPPQYVGLRGGSWLSKPFWWQTYIMGPAHPTTSPACFRGEDVGVRCVRDLTPP